jgi:peptide-methionine (S)-S-oxide reductase
VPVRVATFGAGCFWGVEAAFRELPGVVDAAVGYMGGNLPGPTYPQVCTGRTGHAEVVRVLFDDGVIDYHDLLRHFWTIHDPTTLNRQGPDVGTQYRSVIFHHDESQEAAARGSMALVDRSGVYGDPVVTEVVPASTFWRAEEYHQRYYEKRGMARCRE